MGQIQYNGTVRIAAKLSWRTDELGYREYPARITPKRITIRNRLASFNRETGNEAKVDPYSLPGHAVEYRIGDGDWILTEYGKRQNIKKLRKMLETK